MSDEAARVHRRSSNVQECLTRPGKRYLFIEDLCSMWTTTADDVQDPKSHVSKRRSTSIKSSVSRGVVHHNLGRRAIERIEASQSALRTLELVEACQLRKPHDRFVRAGPTCNG